MQDIKIKVITYKCPNKKLPVICPRHQKPLSRERDCLCDKGRSSRRRSRRRRKARK